MNFGMRKPLRLWPGVVIVILQWLVRFVLPAIVPEIAAYGVIGGVVGGLLILIWWVFFSRAAWIERLGAVILMIVFMLGTYRILDVSIAQGAQGMLFPLLAIPVLSLALVVWALGTRNLPDGLRRVSMVATIVIACGGWAFVRTGGLTARFQNDLQWRWAKTPEERLLAQSGTEEAVLPPDQAPAEIPKTHLVPESDSEIPTPLQPGSPEEIRAKTEMKAEWPGFRGPNRNDIIPGVRINTNWTASPPVELWRRPIGPGWSSFAVWADRIYTQEQRGPEEVVSCYRLSTGKPVWAHRDRARFWESNGGAGPRGTPALSKGRVYTLGATGILNALSADNGAVVWSHNAAADAGAKIPYWGFASSPLVVGDVAIIGVAGQLIAYDTANGARRWSSDSGGVGYSSPHLLTIDGVAQVLLLSAPGVASVSPGDGTLLWEYKWEGSPIVQPAITADGEVLVSVSESSGIRRLTVARGSGGWTVQERWTSNGLKPYFNDFVVHNGYAFGFDGSILACIDLKDGTRKWKGGRYGNGQLVLLSDQDLLLVLSEEGELALVQAAPDQYKELARFPMIEGKTWNHLVLAGDVLLVRNGEEMAAFRLTLLPR